MRSLEGALTQRLVSLWKGEIWTKRHIQREDYGKREREKMAIHKPGTETWDNPSSQPTEGANLADLLILDYWPP